MCKGGSCRSNLSGLSVGVRSGLLADVLISRHIADRRVLWAAIGLVVGVGLSRSDGGRGSTRQRHGRCCRR